MARGYLTRAARMFEEMGMAWDLKSMGRTLEQVFWGGGLAPPPEAPPRRLRPFDGLGCGLRLEAERQGRVARVRGFARRPEAVGLGASGIDS
jgi:hypothetical protein